MKPKIAGGKKLAIENLKHFLIWCTGKQAVPSVVYCTHLEGYAFGRGSLTSCKYLKALVCTCDPLFPLTLSPPSLCHACFSVISQDPDI